MEMGTFSADVVERAWARAKANNFALRNEAGAGRSLFTGYVGEEALASFMRDNGAALIHVDGFEFDFVSQRGVKIEVKTTARCGAPDEQFAVNRVHRDKVQQCDVFVFLQIRWIVPRQVGRLIFRGVIPRRRFEQHSFLENAGSHKKTVRAVEMRHCDDMFAFLELCMPSNPTASSSRPSVTKTSITDVQTETDPPPR
jgi:hypothetical protein